MINLDENPFESIQKIGADFEFQFSFSSRIIDKPTKSKLSKTNLIAFSTTPGTIDLLKQYIKKGYAISPSIYKNGSRKKINVIHSHLLMIDIDNSNVQKQYEHKMTLDEAIAHPFIKKYGLIYTTPSHQQNWHRFRVIFFLQQPIFNPQDYEAYIKGIDAILGGVIDEQAKDASRLFYGNKRAKFFCCENICFVDVDEIKRNIPEVKREFKASKFNGQDSKALIADIEKALEHISPDIDYKSWFNVMCALYHWDDGGLQGFNLFDSWSSQGSKYDGSDSLMVKWHSLNSGSFGKPITIASLFKLAMDNGYKSPKKDRSRYFLNDDTEITDYTNSVGKSKQQKYSNKKRLEEMEEAMKVIEEEFDDRLKFNELTNKLELDGEEADLSLYHTDLILKHKILITANLAQDFLLRHGKNNSYHPIKDYLMRVTKENKAGECIDITKLSSYFFGTEKEIYDEFLYRHILASVARIFFPGIKKDECLVLKGSQGSGKTSFFQRLYGDDFFDSSLNGTSKDDLLIAHSKWCLELAEIEYITRRKETGELKNFISKPVDSFREPYGRNTRTWRRSFVFVGTVNEDDFLRDTTGNRRFWVIPVQGNIDLFAVSELRDEIWAEACRHVNDRISFRLPEKFYQELARENIKHIEADEWTSKVLDYCNLLEQVLTNDILVKALDFKQKEITRREQMRIGNILKLDGWIKKHTKRGKVWVKTDS